MLGSYPSGKPADPETYVAGVIGILERYPQSIVDRVTDPMTGLATKHDFFPKLSQITEACELEMEPHRRAWKEEHEKRLALPVCSLEKTQEERERIAKRAAELTKSLSDPDVKDKAQLVREAALEIQSKRLLETTQEAVKNSKLCTPEAAE
jgi:hypothetical protein